MGDSVAEVKRLIREAVELHIDGLVEDGLPVPEPTTECDYVEARAS